MGDICKGPVRYIIGTILLIAISGQPPYNQYIRRYVYNKNQRCNVGLFRFRALAGCVTHYYPSVGAAAAAEKTLRLDEHVLLQTEIRGLG